MEKLIENKVITFRDAATLLNVSKPTIYRLADSGELSSFRISRARRTTTRACMDYIEEQMKKQGEIDRGSSCFKSAQKLVGYWPFLPAP